MEVKICVTIDRDAPYPERLLAEIVAVLQSRDKDVEAYAYLAKLLCQYDINICEAITAYYGDNGVDKGK